MTSYEHAMLGAGGALACGLHRRYGWQVAALAGVAAMGPDWDGLTLLVSKSVFAEGHRLWGHNLLACMLLGGVIGAVDYRFDLVARMDQLLAKLLRVKTAARGTLETSPQPAGTLEMCPTAREQDAGIVRSRLLRRRLRSAVLSRQAGCARGFWWRAWPC